MKNTMMAVIVAVLCASVAQAGVSYSATTRAKDARGREKEVSKMRAVVDGMDARIDMAAHGGAVPKGGYLVTRDGAKTVTMVDPKKKTYTKWDIDKLAGMAGSIMQGSGGLLNMSVTDHKSEMLLDEKGPKLLGVPTRHYKFRTSYTMSMSVMGFAQKSKIATEQEIWAGQGLADDATALWSRITSFRTGIEDIDKLLAAETGKVKGFPLKTIVVSRTTDSRGREKTSETVTEVTEMKPFKPAKKVFEIPAGFTEEEMMIPGLSTGGRGEDPPAKSDPAAAVNSFLRSFGGKKK
ncbi:MAG: hypothetical protein HN919_21885 [Verrucomicrobia bacterium]|nr:hypothetical protein [Verrucomicrobiota bacterium]